MKHLLALVRRVFVPFPSVEDDLTPQAEFDDAERRAAALAERVDVIDAKLSTYRRPDR